MPWQMQGGGEVEAFLKTLGCGIAAVQSFAHTFSRRCLRADRPTASTATRTARTARASVVGFSF